MVDDFLVICGIGYLTTAVAGRLSYRVIVSNNQFHK
jgi:hypothetical protein